jgi:hypothetical protein
MGNLFRAVLGDPPILLSYGRIFPILGEAKARDVPKKIFRKKKRRVQKKMRPILIN